MKKLLLILYITGIFTSCDTLFGAKDEKEVQIGVSPVGLEETEESIFKALGQGFDKTDFTRYITYIGMHPDNNTEYTTIHIKNDNSELVFASFTLFGSTENINEVKRGHVEWYDIEVDNSLTPNGNVVIGNEYEYYDTTFKKALYFTHESDADAYTTKLNMWWQANYAEYDAFFVKENGEKELYVYIGQDNPNGGVNVVWGQETLTTYFIVP